MDIQETVGSRSNFKRNSFRHCQYIISPCNLRFHGGSYLQRVFHDQHICTNEQGDIQEAEERWM